MVYYWPCWQTDAASDVNKICSSTMISFPTNDDSLALHPTTSTSGAVVPVSVCHQTTRTRVTIHERSVSNKPGALLLNEGISISEWHLEIS